MTKKSVNGGLIKPKSSPIIIHSLSLIRKEYQIPLIEFSDMIIIDSGTLYDRPGWQIEMPLD